MIDLVVVLQRERQRRSRVGRGRKRALLVSPCFFGFFRAWQGFVGRRCRWMWVVAVLILVLKLVKSTWPLV